MSNKGQGSINMSNIENQKDKNKISAGVLFRCTEDLADSIDKQSRATFEINGSLNNLNSKIDSLEKSFTKASISSDIANKSLRWLTFALVVVSFGQLVVGIYNTNKVFFDLLISN